MWDREKWETINALINLLFKSALLVGGVLLLLYLARFHFFPSLKTEETINLLVAMFSTALYIVAALGIIFLLPAYFFPIFSENKKNPIFRLMFLNPKFLFFSLINPFIIVFCIIVLLVFNKNSQDYSSINLGSIIILAISLIFFIIYLIQLSSRLREPDPIIHYIIASFLTSITVLYPIVFILIFSENDLTLSLILLFIILGANFFAIAARKKKKFIVILVAAIIVFLMLQITQKWEIVLDLSKKFLGFYSNNQTVFFTKEGCEILKAYNIDIIILNQDNKKSNLACSNISENEVEFHWKLGSEYILEIDGKQFTIPSKYVISYSIKKN